MTLSALALLSLAAAPEMHLEVDLREAPRRIVHARMTVPASPGPATLFYPKWIPGEHGPTGPVADLAGLRVRAGGKPIPWRRDDVDMYAFHVEVPRGANRLEVALDYLAPPPDRRGFSSSSSYTPNLAVLSWNTALLYPSGVTPRELRVRASLSLPPGWKWGSALAAESEAGGRVSFAPVSLETLVDSPVLAGAHLREIRLAPGVEPPHFLVVASDTEAALRIPAELQARLDRLVAEALALFGARHYRSYRFLLTLSDGVAHFGLEHHESSDNRLPERFFLEPDLLLARSGLLSHEMVHSWNGKYRRPRGLATRDYQEPMRDELLWVYEGLTTYLGDVLTARSGLLSPEAWRDALALDAQAMAATRGRSWRSLEDTAVAAQVLYPSRPEGQAWRRRVDFYAEGALVWLEADVLIRERTKGKRSLDDFCRRFFGGRDGPPEVRPYGLAGVLSALEEVLPHDWKSFFAERVSSVREAPPLAGIERAGWRLAWAATPRPYQKAKNADDQLADHSASIGIVVRFADGTASPGTIRDVVPGTAADKAGVAPGSVLVAVNGRRYTPEVLAAAVAEPRPGGRLELLTEDAGFFATRALEYAGGLRYPALERDPAQPDLLSAIAAPRAGR